MQAKYRWDIGGVKLPTVGQKYTRLPAYVFLLARCIAFQASIAVMKLWQLHTRLSNHLTSVIIQAFQLQELLKRSVTVINSI